MQMITTAIVGVLATTAFVSGANAQYQRWLDVVNTSNTAVYSVFISDVGRNDWGPDLLGYGVIVPGDWRRVEPEYHRGYCRFDIKVVYENGHVEQFGRVNLCVETTLTV